MLPKLFTIPIFHLFGHTYGPWAVPSYGLILFIAFIVALWVVNRQAHRSGMDPMAMTDLAFYALIGGLVGAKVLLIIVDWHAYMRDPRDLLSVFFSGGVFYGGLLGGVAATAWYLWRHKMSPWAAVDVLAPAVVIGQAIGRFACLAAGCCYGRPTNVPWAIVYHNEYAARTVGTPLDVHVHPSPIYESLAAAAIFALLVWMLHHKRFHGQVALSYVVLYSAARFVLEYFRGDVVRGFVFGGAFSTSQFISLLLLLGALALTPYLLKTQRVEARAV
jgi:phosphatidylglycerol:prolipoprotein diacylglycerol transferase